MVCFTPRHDLTLAQLSHAGVLDLLRVLQDQYRELGARPEVRHVLIFENKGEVVGVSNPHPHCQIYATNFVFKTIEMEAEAQAALCGNGSNHLGVFRIGHYRCGPGVVNNILQFRPRMEKR